MRQTPKIVVTGFEPFAQVGENPTLEVLAQLRASGDIEGDLTTIRMPVDSSRIAGLTEEKLDELRPDVWISLGVAPGLSVVAIERIAANVMDFAVPDNAGVRHDGGPVFATGPAAYLSTLPAKAIVSELHRAGIPAKVSNSASTYLCNQMMYTVLHLIGEKRLTLRAGFIHVPVHPSLVAKQTGTLAEMPSMGVDLMTRAVKLAIRATLAAEQAT